MRFSNKTLLISSALLVASTIAPISAATADNAWISRTNLSYVSLAAPAAVKTGNNTSLSTQTSSFVLTYKGPASDAGKFAQVNIFEVSSGLSITMTSTPTASPSGCAQQVLGADPHSCMFALDGSGAAAINVNLSGVLLSSSFKLFLLSGPNMGQTDPAIVSFAAPRSIIKPVVATVKALTGGAALLRFKITENNAAVVGMKADITKTGLGENLSVSSAASDSQGFIYVYLSNLGAKKGSSVITATIQGTSIKTTATITWLTGKLIG